MADERDYRLHRFPRKLIRSLVGFAAAGTIMALVVWSDGEWGVWAPGFIFVMSWLVPIIFTLQVLKRGFDPLERLVATDDRLTAHFRDGETRQVLWTSVTQLLQVEGFRYKAWAVVAETGTIRWFGELEQPDAFLKEATERTGLQWEFASELPAARP